MTGTDGIRSPRGSTTASITFVCVATSTFGARWRSTHAARRGSAAASARSSMRGRGEGAASEAGRALTPRGPTGVDEARGDEGRSVGRVADERHEAVELLAEPGGGRSEVGHAAAAAELGQRRHAGEVGHERRPAGASDGCGRGVGPHGALRTAPTADRALAAGRPAPRPRTWSPRRRTLASATTRSRRRRRVGRTSARMGAVSRDARTECGRTSPTRPPSGRTSAQRADEEPAAASAYGPPPSADRPPRLVAGASCLR